MPVDYTQCQVRKQSNECESEKRLVKSQRSGVALTEYGARGALAGRALPTSTACVRKTVLPPRDYINSFAFTIRSPSREHASIIFFGSELGLYQFVRLHNSFAFTGTRINYLLRAGARTEPHMGDIFRSIFIYRLASAYCCPLDRFSVHGIAHERHLSLSFYLPPSVGLLLTILGKIFCTRLRSRIRGIFRSSFIYRRASAYLSKFLECDPNFSVRIFSSEHQFVRLQEKNVIKIFRFARSRSSIGATNSLAFKAPM